MISERARKWTGTSYAMHEGSQLARADPYDADTNPNGCVNLGVAENELMFDMLSDKLSNSNSLRSVTREELRYSDLSGLPCLRQALANFLNDTLSIPSDLHLNSDMITVHNGCGSALECLFNVICDHGDSVLIPTPYYGGLDMDLERRVGARIIPIPLSSESGYTLTHEDLKCAIKGCDNVRALLLMNPHNPLGTVYTRSQIQMATEFCHEMGIHLVIDEIYALSIFDNDARQTQYQSALARHDLFEIVPEHTHIIWGFSKDFCMNGLRVGVNITRNKSLIEGLRAQSYFSGVSSLTQNLLMEIVTDKPWYDNFIATNHSRLLSAYRTVTTLISEYNKTVPSEFAIRYVTVQAGFFVYIDLSPYLFATTETMARQREYDLYMKLISDGKVYITPGHAAFHDAKPGSFRVVFAQNDSTLRLAFTRLFSTLRKELQELNIIVD